MFLFSVPRKLWALVADFLFLPVSKILLPTLKFGRCLATKFSNWLKVGDGVIEISVSTPCKILIWGGLGGEEWAWRDLAKNFASKFSDWLDRVLLTTSRVLFRSVPDEIFGRPVRHRIARLKFWFRRVVWLPKFWVGDTPTSTTDVHRTCVVFSFAANFQQS